MKIFLGGIVALVVGIILLIFWWWDFLTMIKVLIPVILLVGGGFAAYSGYDEIKEKMVGEPEKVEPTFKTTTETSTEPSEVTTGAAEEKKPERPKAPRTPRKRGARKKEA